MTQPVDDAAARERLLSAEEVSEFLQIPLQTLYQWRVKGAGPKCARVGRHLRYRQSDVDAWVESQTERGVA